MNDVSTPTHRRTTSTITSDPPPAPNEIVRRVEALAPMVAARATETEATRRVPPDLLDELRATGCVRVLLPRSHGGTGAPLPTAMDVFETLARADASTGWAVAIAASVWCDLTGLPRATFDLMYDHPDRIVAGAFSPSGTASETTGGYRVEGRWPFASGCVYADWIYGNAIEMVDGQPSFRTILFTPDQVAIEDTWHVLGMRGTASHHFRAGGVIVPAERTFATFTHEPCLDAPIVHVAQPTLFALEIAGVALGGARAALDDLGNLAADKVPFLADTPLVADRAFQHHLARADAELRAARGLLWDCAGEVWESAEAGSEPTAELVARARAAAAWSTTTAVGVADTAFRLGGGTTVYDDSPLQRRLRDLHVIGQHFLVKPETLTTAGAVLAGQPIDVPVF